MTTTAPPTEAEAASRTIEAPVQRAADLDALFPGPLPQRHELQA